VVKVEGGAQRLAMNAEIATTEERLIGLAERDDGHDDLR
jgi:hypothetical protein